MSQPLASSSPLPLLLGAALIGVSLSGSAGQGASQVVLWCSDADEKHALTALLWMRRRLREHPSHWWAVSHPRTNLHPISQGPRLATRVGHLLPCTLHVCGTAKVCCAMSCSAATICMIVSTLRKYYTPVLNRPLQCELCSQSSVPIGFEMCSSAATLLCWMETGVDILFGRHAIYEKLVGRA